MLYKDLSGNGPGGVELRSEVDMMPIRFASAPVSVFGRTLYPSVETFNLGNGDRLDVEAMLMNTAGSTNAAGIWIGDGIKAIYIVRAAAGVDVDVGRYSAGDASLGAPAFTAGAYEGLNLYSLSVIPYAGGTRAIAGAEGRIIPTTSVLSTGNFINTAPVRIYITTDDVNNSRVSARQY